MKKRAVALLAAAVTALGSVTATPAAAAMPGSELGWYSVPYASTLYWAHRVGPTSTELRPASYAEWQAAGFPAPRPVAADYVRVPWWSTIVAIPQIPGWVFPGRIGESDVVTYDGWARAGFPTPRTVAHLPNSIYTQAPGSAEIWVEAPEAAAPRHLLTLGEWIAAGSPSPIVRTPPVDPGTVYVQWSTSPEIFAVVGDSVRKLSFAAWAAAGYPTPTRLSGGFHRLTWHPTIVQFDTDIAFTVSYDDWAAEGFPTPAMLPTLPGDQYCHDVERDVVAYDGFTVQTEMSPAEAEQRLGVPLADIPAC